MKYNMSCVLLQLKRQTKVLVLIHNINALACVNLSAINLIWDKFILLNCHSFQLIGKIMIYKKIKYIPEWIFFSINKIIFLFQSNSPFHISLPWINTKEISCWISLPSHHTVISVKNKKRSWSLPWRSVITHPVEHWPTKQNSTKIPHQATDTIRDFFKVLYEPKHPPEIPEPDMQNAQSWSCKAGEYSIPWKRGHSFNLPHTHWIILWRHLYFWDSNTGV